MTGPAESGDPFGDWRGVAPAAVRLHALLALAAVPLPLLALLVDVRWLRGIDPALLPGIVGGLVALLALNVVRTVVWFSRFRFRLTDTTAETRSQVVTRAIRVVPLGRIQHVDVTAGPLERALRIASVSAHTAAGEATIVVPGLPQATADLLRERLLKERRREAV